MSGTFMSATLVGYLGHDVQVQRDEAGTAYCTINLAVHEKRNGQQHTTWFKVRAADRLAETLEKYAKKGQRIFATGQVKSDRIVPQSGRGNGRIVYYLCADHLRLMD